MKLSESQALNRTASYCSKAERCEFDVRRKLALWEQDSETTERIVKRLISEKFLNDERFCRSYINDKIRFNKWGKIKIISELKKRNIPSSIYLPLLAEVADDEFEQQLDHIIKVKVKSVKAKDRYDKRNKLIRFALSRGFSMELTLKCINKITGDEIEMDL